MTPPAPTPVPTPPLTSRALTAAIYLLVADGVAALYLGGLLGTAGLVLVSVAVVGSWWQESLRQRLEPIPRLGTMLVGLAGAALVAEIVTAAGGMLDVFTHLLIFLLLVKLYSLRTLRDARDVAFLAFFMLVAISPVTTSVVFLGLFVTFLVVSTWLLMLNHLLLETDIVAGPTGPLGRDVLRLSLAASATTVAVTALLFLVIPRVGQAALPLGMQASRMVSGFTERVRLGAFGEIETDPAVVMRVRLASADLGAPERFSFLRWRGIAFDHFDGRSWTVGPSTLKLTLRRNRPVPFPVHPHRGGPVLTQEIDLEPIDSRMIFAAPRLLSLQGRSDFATVDDLGNVAVPAAAARLHYTVESEPELGDPRQTRAADGQRPQDPRWQARYTQLPHVSPRVATLAREVTAGSGDAYESARRLSAWLGQELAYTRALEAPASGDPIDDFLFVRRAGNCEYFAAALAVMLRSLQIPARVVNGFQRGEWNPYGEYFMVRLRDAHSWVEVFVDGAGWVTIDPSPRAPDDEAAPAAPPAMLWLDSMRMSWYRHVVRFSLHDQLAVVDTVRRGTWSAAALKPSEWGAAAPLSTAAAALVVAVVAVLILRQHRRRAGERRARTPAFYVRALRLLARRGLVPAAGETARELLRRAPAAWTPALARLTAAYERVRFGGVALTPAESADVDAALAALAGAVRATRAGA
jgi:protein-glutamine gamma-glutamyltransferase